MQIYCDESGGVGRGVMTLAAVLLDEAAADGMLSRFRAATGYQGEVKGSRISLPERQAIFDLLAESRAPIHVGIAISALVPRPQQDRGQHDVATYSRLLDETVASMLPFAAGCAEMVIDDGRYGTETLARIRAEIAAIIGPCGSATLELSHRRAGLQLADVVANSFFGRALVTGRQARLAAIVAPLLKSGQIRLKTLARFADAPTVNPTNPAR